MTSDETIGGLLHEGRIALERAAIDDAELEADVLLRHAMGLGADRAHLIASMHDAAPPGLGERYGELLRRRASHEPTAYITGQREFYGLEFACSPAALIPRPETELLVELAVAWLAERAIERPLIIDAGTGSGALAVALAVACPSARVVALDVSGAALRLARQNAARHGVAVRIDLVRCDLIGPIRGRADLIVANLPYVAETDWPALAPEITEHEPKRALTGGAKGTEIIERLLREARPALADRSLLLCECGDTQGERLTAAARRAYPDARVAIHKDLAGLDRVLQVALG